MGKRGGGNGSIRLFLILVLLGLVGYDTYEISHLRTEVDSLRAASRGESAQSMKDAGPAGHETNSAPVNSNNPQSLLSDARIHAGRAQSDIGRGDFGQARHELETASEEMHRAGSDAGAESASTLSGLRDSASQLADKAGRMLSGSDASKSGGGSGAAAGSEKVK